jgi:N-acetyl-gamma-glutamyl-phosphate reductase
MIRCGIIGATGYAGSELTRLLLRHPEVGALALSSTSFEGKTMESVYPNLVGVFPKAGPEGPASGTLVSMEEAIEASDVVFSSLPHGLAEESAAACLAEGKLFIDLSADFRFGIDEATFTAWYGKPYTRPELHAISVYGLPELNRARIAKARVIGNPGCYPTCAALGLFPALRLGLADPGWVIVDAASGVTGAGREPSRSTHYPEAADSIAPYKIGEHRHGPEIAAILSEMAGAPVGSVFTPHLAPMGRGIVSTNYFRLAKSMDAAALRAEYASFYSGEPFVRVLPAPLVATNRNVRFSNYCDISVHMATDGRTAIVVSTIDNMVKGAAGQAIQNMNVALGLDEAAGLSMLPPAF